MHGKHREKYLKMLRNLMKSTKYASESIQAYIIPSGDHHQSEYISDCAKRRAFICGFTGTKGTAVVTESDALLWTDGRYYLQAQKQMDRNWTLMKDGLPSTPSLGVWLNSTLPHSSTVGVDPWLVSSDFWQELARQLASNQHRLIPVTENLIDVIWEGRPLTPCNDVLPHPMKFSGCSWPSKVKRVRQKMEEKGSVMLVLTALDDIAWLYNLRGSDVPYNPVFFSWAVVTPAESILFIDDKKLPPAAKTHLSEEGDSESVVILAYDQLSKYLAQQSSVIDDGKVWLARSSSYILSTLIPRSKLLDEATPVEYMKTIKNAIEIKGMKSAHIKDGVAICRHLCWLESEVDSGSITEVVSASKLEEFRSEEEAYVGKSFETISAVGANASVIHYRPSVQANVLLNRNEVYLLDCGAQFKDGTTDVTRTIHFGTPTDFEKECFTRVLKGHIGLASAVFPANLKGNFLDSLARLSLWEAGLDYPHGTGHGVGSYLNVHEGPIRITWFYSSCDPGLEAGMFVSDEPGYYENGKFGIRIESILATEEASTQHKFRDQSFIKFQPVTVVPIQRKMIDASMLTTDEIRWLNDYHSFCFEKVGPLLKEKYSNVYQWLQKQTEPL